MRISPYFFALITVTFLAGCMSSKNSSAWSDYTRQGDEALSRNDPKAAQEYYSSAVQVAGKFKAKDPRLSVSLGKLAGVCFAQGQYLEAQALCQRQIMADEKRLGATNASLADNLVRLAEVEEAMKNYANADELYRRAQNVVENGRGASTPALGIYLSRRARLYSLQGNFDQAEEFYTKGLNFVEDAQFNLSFSSESAAERTIFLVEAARIRNEFGLMCEKQGKLPQAETLFVRAEAALERQFGKENVNVASVLNNVARVCDKQKKFSEAESAARRSLLILEKIVDPDHPMLKEARELLDSIQAEKAKKTESP